MIDINHLRILQRIVQEVIPTAYQSPQDREREISPIQFPTENEKNEEWKIYKKKTTDEN